MEGYRSWTGVMQHFSQSVASGRESRKAARKRAAGDREVHALEEGLKRASLEKEKSHKPGKPRGKKSGVS